MADDIAVKFGAQIGPLQAGAAQAAQAVQQSTALMRANMQGVTSQAQSFNSGLQQAFSGITSAASGMHSTVGAALNGLSGQIQAVQGTISAALGGITKVFAVATAALAGGEMFRGLIKGAAEWTGQTTALSRQLGITTEQASALSVALQRNGISAELYSSAFQMLTRQARQNEDGLRQLGIVTRDHNGRLLDGQQLMMNALRAMSQYSEGTARAMAGQRAFGRGAGEVSSLLKLLREDFVQDAEMAKRFGLVVTNEGARSLRAYKNNLNDVNLMLMAVKVNIGGPLVSALASLRPGVEGAIAVFGKFLDFLRGTRDAAKDMAQTLNQFAEDWQKMRGGPSSNFSVTPPSGTNFSRDGFSSDRAAALVAQYESKNRAYIGYGETNLLGYPQSPTGFPIWPGKMGPQGKSHAAGLYQFEPGTWDPIASQLGVRDFSPGSQRRVFDEAFRTSGFQPWTSNAALMAAVQAERQNPASAQTPPPGSSAPAGTPGSAAGPAGGRDFDENAFKEKQQQIEEAYNQRQIAARNSLEQQIASDRQRLEQERALVRERYSTLQGEELSKQVEKDENVRKARESLMQKQGQLWDQETRLYVAKLHEQMAATTDPKARVALQQEILRTAETGGTNVTGRSAMGKSGGVNVVEVQQERNALAALERQSGQDTLRMAEASLSRAREMGQLRLEADTAEDQRRVALHQESQLQATKNEATATQAMLAEQKKGAEGVLALATAMGLSNEQLEKFRDAIEKIGLEAKTRAAQDLVKITAEQQAILNTWTQPIQQAFSQVESSLSSAASGLITGATTWGNALKSVSDSIIKGFVDSIFSTLSKSLAKGLGASAGQGLFDYVGKSLGDKLFGSAIGATVNAGTDAALATTITGSATAFAGEVTAAGATFAASVAGAGAASGASSLAGGAASAGGAAAGAGGLFGWIGSLFQAAPEVAVLAASRGMIVPSAAGGWSLPSFAGAQPALLHSKEMVLPAPISEGIQSAIAGGGFSGGGAGDVHVHFHGPADGPSVNNWFKGMMRSNPDAVRNLFRNNALTPRTI